MSVEEDRGSAPVEIAKRNGDFRKNFGPSLGAYLYLQSVNAAASGTCLVEAAGCSGLGLFGWWMKS
jgi:hypothetical protein